MKTIKITIISKRDVSNAVKISVKELKQEKGDVVSKITRLLKSKVIIKNKEE